MHQHLKAFVVSVTLALLVATAAQAAPKQGDTWRDPLTSMEFVRIPKGCSNMGSPSSEAERYVSEGPVHEVCVSGFWMAKYHVTVAQFRQFVQAAGYRTDADKQGKAWGIRDGKLESIDGLNWQNPGFPQDDRHPAVAISWNDAKAYAKWLSGKTGKKYRLPTEAEWEYAARAGTTTSRYWGDNPDDACDYANGYDQTSKRVNGFGWDACKCADGYAQTAPVGSFRPNAFGLYDMLGNAWQGCEDIYHGNSYTPSPQNNPVVTGVGPLRASRGGGWRNNVRTARRGYIAPDYAISDQGFRLVRIDP